MKNILFILALFLLACKQQPNTTITPWVPYDESEVLAKNAEHESPKMQYKLIQSKVLDKNDLWANVSDQIKYFSNDDYLALKPLILEQDIPTLQSYIESGELTYETLTQWYLYRIVIYENDKDKALNAIISINPNAVSEARKRDKNKSENDHPIYGIPVLLKDNINFEGLPTTAGAEVLRNNETSDAFIVEKLKEKGAVILGKTNLSEWANYLCNGCPNGYSAMGGQTLNPYGPRLFDTGGSSSGSGAAIAANYASVAIGTETSGSILSPSSANSIIGLKPTVGLLSRGGIVPISGTLDTPGPMTRNVIDNAILLSALSGEDFADGATKDNPKNKSYWEDLNSASLQGLRFGVNKEFLSDSIYKLNVERIVSLGGIVFEFVPEEIDFEGFVTLLSTDMMADLPGYLHKYGSKEISVDSVSDIVNYNKQDTLLRIPYGQARFAGILDEAINADELVILKDKLHNNAISFFETPMLKYELDAVLSINNWNAGYAAAAKYPCLTIPMGYREKGEPVGITFIVRPYEEDKLLKMGYAFETAFKMRKLPEAYQ